MRSSPVTCDHENYWDEGICPLCTTIENLRDSVRENIMSETVNFKHGDVVYVGWKDGDGKIVEETGVVTSIGKDGVYGVTPVAGSFTRNYEVPIHSRYLNLAAPAGRLSVESDFDHKNYGSEWR